MQYGNFRFVLFRKVFSDLNVDAIKQKMKDPDEKIRRNSVQIVLKLCEKKQMDILKQMPKSIIQEMAERCKDKKLIVRQEAINTIARVYNAIYKDLY